MGANGVVQAAVSRIWEKFGLPKLRKLHSPRNWFATCAGQLLHTRERREKVGRRAPGSVTPDHYGREVCATELRARSEIIAKFNSARGENPPNLKHPGIGRKKRTKQHLPKHKGKGGEMDMGSLSSGAESASETESEVKTDKDVESIAELDS